VPAVGVPGAVMIPEIASAVEVQHALHEVDVEVDPSRCQGVGQARPNRARQARSGPEIVVVVLNLRELRLHLTAHPQTGDTQGCPQRFHHHSYDLTRSQVAGHDESTTFRRWPCCCPPLQCVSHQRRCAVSTVDLHLHQSTRSTVEGF
jgi:hypothetical protein